MQIKQGVPFIDVSHHDGNIDWVKVKAAGYNAAYLKASEGSTWKDPMFHQYVKDAQAAGVLVGAYHFARPESDTAVQDAANFLSTIADVKLDLIPVLDIETPDSKALGKDVVEKWINDFVYKVQSTISRKVMIYTGEFYIDLNGNPDLSRYPLWIAVYNTDTPQDNGGHNHWDGFQYSDKGIIPGISGNVDMDVAMSLDFLKTGEYPVTPSKPISKLCNVYVNNVKVSDYGVNYPTEGYTLTPIRTVTDAFKLGIGWDDVCKKAIVNNQLVDSTEIRGGIGYAQSHELAVKLGKNVSWDNANNAIKFS